MIVCHRKGLHLEVHVAPAQPEYLSSPHPGHRGEVKGGLVAVTVDVGEECRQLCFVPAAHLSLLACTRLGRPCAVGNVDLE